MVTDVFKVKKSSWHYKIVSMDRPDFVVEDMNFCQYWRSVIFNILAYAGSSLLFIALIILLSYSIGGLVLGVEEFGTMFVLSTLIGFATIFIISSSVYLIVEAFRYFKERVSNKSKKTHINKEKEPGLIAMRYQSWKNKFCPAIELED